MRAFWKRKYNAPTGRIGIGGLKSDMPLKHTTIKKLTVENRIELLNQALCENNITVDAVISINETQYHLNIFYRA